jgi:hypothetical protein
MLNKKNILAFSMLLLVVAPLIFFMGFLVKREIIYHEMMEKLESASLHTITVRVADVNWKKKNKEVVIDGKLFDIKYTEIIDNEIKLTGLFDEEENKLEKDFTNTFNSNKNQQTPFSQLKLKFIFNFYFIEDHLSNSVSVYQSKNSYSTFNEVAVTKSSTVVSPPPNL